jgi:thioredoxin-like negative regulator of GroEL
MGPLDSKETGVTDDKTGNEPDKPKGISPSMIVILLVVAVLSAVVVAKMQGGATTAPSTTAASAENGASAQATGATITSVHNDASADFKSALLSGKPVYVLFHSLSCQPCVEISAVVDKVMPAYEGKVAFVNAISEDESSRELATKFKFQYIPTSFFIKPDGSIADSFTGAMSEAEMKTRLDKLIAR